MLGRTQPATHQSSGTTAIFNSLNLQNQTKADEYNQAKFVEDANEFMKPIVAFIKADEAAFSAFTNLVAFLGEYDKRKTSGMNIDYLIKKGQEVVSEIKAVPDESQFAMQAVLLAESDFLKLFSAQGLTDNNVSENVLAVKNNFIRQIRLAHEKKANQKANQKAKVLEVLSIRLPQLKKAIDILRLEKNQLINSLSSQPSSAPSLRR